MTTKIDKQIESWGRLQKFGKVIFIVLGTIVIGLTICALFLIIAAISNSSIETSDKLILFLN